MTERKKTTLIVILSAIGLLIGTIPIVDFMLATGADGQSHILAFQWLDKINFFHWGWLIGFAFAGFSIAGIVFWKPSTRLFRGFVILLSVISVLLSAHWLFWIIAILNLPT
jgi:hypothetical protein